MTDLIQIDKSPVKEALRILLQDKTTGENIIFATDMYSSYGYSECNQMTETAILGFDSCDIQPRVLKAQSEQSVRTRKKAEVFTPTWICNRMNNHCDDEWFGTENIFNKQEGQIRHTNPAPIPFENEKAWQKYVDSRRLEITCGEAPYIVSRYDATTGEPIPVTDRIGILDRKLRVVNENTETEDMWYKWTIRAFQSVYGYEFQGDNLLIARINLLMTFCDYLYDKWQRQATKKEIQKIANIIAWNFWQMDGLTDKIPVGFPEEDFHQLSLFEEDTQEKQQSTDCKIYDWRKDISKVFGKIKAKKESGVNMKFDFVIGNPPYQQEISSSDDNKSLSKQIFPDFIYSSVPIANTALVLITPSRWFAGDAQDKSFVKLRDFLKENNHISKIVHYQDEKDVFNNVIIKGGVSYFTYKPNYAGLTEFTTVTNGVVSVVKRPMFEEGLDIVLSNPMQVSILMKIKEKSTAFLTDITKGRNAFGIIGKEDVINEISSKIKFDNCCELRIKGDEIRYIAENVVVKNIDVFNAYKVFISKSAGAPGKDMKIIGRAYVGKTKSACSDSLIPVGCFETELEANNLQKYMSTKFLRFMVSILKVSQNVTQIVYRYVPLQDFTEKSDIDWSKSVAEIDRQLYAKYGLSQEEIDFIETHVKEMT